jgi:GR25 family glycosyltransferase involved in LPS biosynthesis
MIFIAYILSIKNSDRREHVENLSKKLLESGFQTVEIIDAIYWKEDDVLNIVKELDLKINTNNIALSQIACFLTHRKSWEIIATKKYDSNIIHIIIEDDMDITESFSIEELEKVYHSIDPTFYDSIFLYKHPEQASKPDNLILYNEFLLKHYFQWGTCAYSIHPDFAKELCNFTVNMDCSLDNFLQIEVFQKYKKNRIFYSINDYFLNLGFLGGNYGEYRFKSNIWS